MRIFVLASWYPSEADPLRGIFVEEQVLALRRHHQVVVLAPMPRSWRRTVAAGGRAAITIEQRRGIDVVRVPAGSPLPGSWRIRQAAYVRAAGRAFREAVERYGKPDLVHAHVVLPGGDAAVRVAAAAGVPVVLTEHSNPFAMHLIDGAHRRRAAGALAGADAVIAVGPVLREQMFAFRPQTNIAIVGNVIDTDFFTSAPRPPQLALPEFRLLSVGLLTPSKGMHNVIDAFALAISRAPRPMLLTIAGDGPERQALELQAKAKGIEESVRFAGSLDRDGVRDALRTSDGFVLASDTESFGVVVAEAMACSCPVIATRSGGPDWLIPPGGGQLVPVGEPSMLADAIASLASGIFRPDLEAARRSIVERFGPEAVIDQLEAVYRSVVVNRSRSSP